MRAVRRVAAVLATTALLLGGFAAEASAVSVDVAGLVVETPQV
ncbi:hypothetical protein [Streptomyces sp. S.PNR 29]|nr:hypothetical protein [Streptomyces sp. S.PNR 29]MDN0194154.1 hypothetical protein [Streptomyces sp. S.PNR 29]